MNDAQKTTSFCVASREVLRYLHARLGFDLWMVTRTQDRDWIVLEAEDHGYEVKNGDVFQWADSFCSRMVAGLGPRIAPRSDSVRCYAEAPIGQQVEIGAYIGLPLKGKKGELFGTLCAIDPQPQPEHIVEELPQIEVLAKLLEAVLASEQRANEEARRADRAEAQAMTDSLTGLFNRRGWDQLLSAEEERCSRYAHPAVVIMVDLDDLKVVNDRLGHSRGDELIQSAAHIIRENVRKTDIVARVGGDEFMLLAIECSEHGGPLIVERLEGALEAAGIAASIGSAYRHTATTLLEASQRSDEAMYECKRRRKMIGDGAALSPAGAAPPDER